MNIEQFQKDWRNMGQLEYMFEEKVKYVKSPTITSDHEHCIFCWETISEHENMQHEAYCTIDNKNYICMECFEELRDIFKWEIISS